MKRALMLFALVLFAAPAVALAALSASPTSGQAPLTVQFSGTVNSAGYSIDYGDGTSSGDVGCAHGGCPATPAQSTVNKTHQYTAAGTYTAKLRQHYTSIAANCAGADCNVVGSTTITVTGGGSSLALPLVTLSTPQGGQPPNATISANASVPAVAIALTAGGTPATITGLGLQRVGSAADGAVAGLKVVDTENNVLGTATGFSAGRATIPFSLTIPAGERRTLVVFVTVAADLVPYQGQFFNLNITALNTSAVANGPLPLYGAQLGLSSGVSKPACRITANPSSYIRGQTVTIDWVSANATGGTITGLGAVGPAGRQGILPSGSGTYTGTFTGPGGTGACTVAITQTNGTVGGVFDPGKVVGPGSITDPGRVYNPDVPLAGQGGTGGSVLTGGPVCSGIDCRLCDFASLGQRVLNFFTGLSIPIAAVMFAWAGILYFTSAASPENLNRARSAFRVAFLGFLIAITAWLVVQTLAKALMPDSWYVSWNTLKCPEGVRPGTTLQNSSNFSDILGNTVGTPNTDRPTTGGGGGNNLVDTGNANTYINQSFYEGTPTCRQGFTYSVDPEDPSTATCFNNEDPEIFEDPTYVAGGGGGVTSGRRGYAMCTDGNTNCSVPVMMSHGLTETQARTMSCIAVTENSGNAVNCSGTGPCGTFQITQTNWQRYAPAGCRANDFGGNIVAAQNNGACNSQVAARMVQTEGYQPWTGACNTQGGCNVGTRHEIAYGDPWNPAARTCVNNYDPN